MYRREDTSERFYREFHRLNEILGRPTRDPGAEAILVSSLELILARLHLSRRGLSSCLHMRMQYCGSGGKIQIGAGT